MQSTLYKIATKLYKRSPATWRPILYPHMQDH